MRIVVVEDGAKIRRGIINLIQRINSDYQVVGEAGDGIDGLKIIAELQPDLVIADIRMPELNGLEMLQNLKEKGIKHKTIIISAFSDFSFAQQAITVGVSEYLLKPITAEKLRKTLTTIEQELAVENQKSQSSQLLTVKHMLHDLMSGKTGTIKDLQQYLQIEGWFESGQSLALVGAYTGNKIYDQEALHQVLNQLISENSDLKYLVMDLEVSGLTSVLVTGKSDFRRVETFLENTLLDAVHQHDFPNLVMGWIPVDSLEEIPTKLQQLREMLKWALIFGKDEMLTQSKVAHFELKPLIYPNELEKQAINGVYRKDFKDLQVSFENFVAWWQEKPFHPEQITAGFIRFISAITNAIKETNGELFKHVKQEEILQRVLGAITMDQLEAALAEMLHRLNQTEQTQNANYSLTVVKALKIITEDFHHGITREEIATRLHITPEYLSMLFYKEVGLSFTAYIKNYRINKAKELLTNTDLKVYEIAERVGYPDPKYFCRVFKEVTGVSAGEYQKSHL